MSILRKARDAGSDLANLMLGGVYEGPDFDRLSEEMKRRKEGVARAIYEYAEQLSWLSHHYPERAEGWESFLDMTLQKFGEYSCAVFPYSRTR